MTTVLSVEGLGKQYRRKRLGAETLREDLDAWWSRWTGRSARQLPPAETPLFWALRNVTFEARQGEVLGVLGRNGAGKSTLLKILTEVTAPTEGVVRIRGRTASLLEVGAGFHPELTGQENIFLNGSILGMSRAEIRRKLAAIVDFSEVGAFMDTPVKRYSSGMYVRLAFAVAAHLDPDILLVDEVLAVGDTEFQHKCIEKLRQVAADGRTVLFVSHSMPIIQAFCTRALLLRGGEVEMDGPVDQVVKAHLNRMFDLAARNLDENPERQGTGEIRLTAARSLDPDGRPERALVAGRPCTLEFAFQNHSSEEQAELVFTIFNSLGVAVTHLGTAISGFILQPIGERGTVICKIPSLPFPPGRYRVSVAINLRGENVDLVPSATVFDVTGSVFYETGRTPDPRYCAALVACNWTFDPDRTFEHDVPTRDEVRIG